MFARKPLQVVHLLKEMAVKGELVFSAFNVFLRNASVAWLGSLGRVVDSFYSKSCGFFPLGAIGLGMPRWIRATVIAKDPYVFALTFAACRHCFKLVRIKSYVTTGKVPIPKMLGNFGASVLFLAWSMCLRFRSSCRTAP